MPSKIFENDTCSNSTVVVEPPQSDVCASCLRKIKCSEPRQRVQIFGTKYYFHKTCDKMINIEKWNMREEKLPVNKNQTGNACSGDLNQMKCSEEPRAANASKGVDKSRGLQVKHETIICSHCFGCINDTQGRFKINLGQEKDMFFHKDCYYFRLQKKDTMRHLEYYWKAANSPEKVCSILGKKKIHNKSENNSRSIFGFLFHKKKVHNNAAEDTPSPKAILKKTRKDYQKKQIIVPAGKTGVVLSTSKDGKGTVVSKIDKRCVLNGVLQPGDKLVAIDNEDVTGMTLSQISLLMTSKANQERRLTVITA